MMKLHSFGTAVNCGQCGQPCYTLYAESPHAAIHLGQGVCPTCYKVQAIQPQVERTVKPERRRTGRSLVGMVEDERERELMRGQLTGATVEQAAEECTERAEECASPVEESEGDGSEGGSL